MYSFEFLVVANSSSILATHLSLSHGISQIRIMSNTGASTPLPKIKLKLLPTTTPTINSTGGTPRNSSTAKLSTTDVKKGYKKKTGTVSNQEMSSKKKKMTSSPGTSLTPSPVLTSEADPVTTAAVSYSTTTISGGTSKTGKRRLPGNIAESDGLFGDYTSALKAAITYQRTKNWTSRKAQLRTATGYTLDLTEWCTKHTSRPILNTAITNTQVPPKRHSLQITMEEPGKRPKSTKSVALPASQVIKLAKQGSNTFVCTHEGCHRIFDDQTRWRRHQNGHIRHVK